eukprot:m.183685 g.183685  ORF g.183685 m.183685 type:complete len:60 (+) comp32165_c1_seq6:91-270(+)
MIMIKFQIGDGVRGGGCGCGGGGDDGEEKESKTETNFLTQQKQNTTCENISKQIKSIVQ